MKKSYSNTERRGLPGGPNEEINYSNLSYSTQGYKRFSPDVNNPFNIINSGRITMKDVDFPITGVDNLGYRMTMMPDEEYEFPGNEVLEIPHKNIEMLQPHHEDHHSNVHGFAGIIGDAVNHIGAYGGFDTKHFGLHGSYLKPLQQIAHNSGDMHLSAEYRGGNDRLNFNVGPTFNMHGSQPSFGVQGGLRFNFKPGGETDGMGGGDPDMLNFYYNYINSDKYKERLKSSGYANPQEIADKRQNSHWNTEIHYKDEVPGNWNAFMDILKGRPTNASGSSYIPGDKMGETTTGDILVYDGQAKLEGTTSGDIERHERAHAMVQDAELNDYDQRQFSERETESSRNKGYRRGKKIPIGNQQLEESYADMTGLRYTIFDELGIDATKDITDEDMSKIQNLIKGSKYKSAKRLFDAYSPEDIKWMLNNIASNQSVSSDQMQMAQPGGEIEEDMMYSQPIEDIISDRKNDSYEYKRSQDPRTGAMSYYQRKKGSGTWKDAGKEGSTGYRAVTDVFGDDKTGYANSPERAQFVQKMRMNNEDYIRGLLDKANHPLDLVYGNPQLGIPAFGPEIKNMSQYQDDFFDPYGQEEDRYIQYDKPGTTQTERDAAAKREQENFLSNRGQTQEEYDASEKIRMEREAKEHEEWRAQKERDRLEQGHDGFGGNVVGGWEYTGQTPDEYYADMQDSGLGEIMDYTGMTTAMNVLGVSDAIKLGYDIQDEGWGALADGGNLLTVAGLIPGIGMLGRGANLVGKGGRLLKTGKNVTKAIDAGKDVYNRALKPVNQTLNKIGDVRSSSKFLNEKGIGSLSDFNKNVLKKNWISSADPAMQKNIDNVFNATKKVGLSNDAWGAATAYGMYNSADAVDRIIHGEGSTDDFVKAGLNFIPGANVAKTTGLATYGTKAGLKAVDKSGLFDDEKNQRQVTQQNNPVKTTVFQGGGEPEVEGRRNLNDLYVSPSDLAYLNRAKNDSNEYYCSPNDVGCLASSYDAYDKLVGQRYRSDEFLSEQNLKKSLGLQSLPSYRDSLKGTGYDWDPETNDFVYYENDEESKRYKPGSTTHDWIMKYKDYFQKGYEGEEQGGGYDFTADSWDIHGILVDQGGQNIFTGGADWRVDEDDEGNPVSVKGNMMTSEKLKNLYSQMTPGTIIGFNNYKQGLNPKKGLTGSGHSTQVVGYDERGVPVIYDYGDYLPIDKLGLGEGGLYSVDKISNITIPKEHIGKNLEWAREKGYYTGEDPKDLNLNLEPILSEWGQDDDELPDFYSGLKDEKFNLMDDLNLKEGQYNDMAAALIGISMEETEGGGGFQHNVEQLLPGTAGQDTSGLTQLMWSNIEDDEKLKKIAEKYGITKQSDLKDSRKSAIASMIYGSRNYLAAQKNLKKGKKEGVRTYYPPGWKGALKRLKGDKQVYDGKTFITEGGEEIDLFTGNNWSGIGWTKDLEDIQEQLDAASEAEGIPGRYIARKTTDDDGDEVIVIDKKTLGNAEMDPIDAFIYNWNSPYALTSGDAQGGSGYVKNVKSWMDRIKMQAGGEITPEHVQQKQKTLEQELAKMEQYNLNPAQKMQLTESLISTYNDTVPYKFKMGGPTLSPELQMYKDYIVGKDESEKARKNYDKLNRVYYREAKIKNMRPANFIMTELIS